MRYGISCCSPVDVFVQNKSGNKIEKVVLFVSKFFVNSGDDNYKKSCVKKTCNLDLNIDNRSKYVNDG